MRSRNSPSEPMLPSQQRRKFVLALGSMVSASLLVQLASAKSLAPSTRRIGVTNGVEDATASIQSMIDKLPPRGGIVTIPTGQHYINAEHGLLLRSGVTMNFESGSILRAIPTNSNKYSLIRIYGADGVIIRGGQIVGERTAHLGKGGEWGMGISIRGSSNVQIHDTEVSECWGDGIYIGSYSRDGIETPSENILIKRVTSKRNRRQGLSITSCRGAKIVDSKFIETSGTSPASGIDLEPNKGQPVTNVLIENCDLNDNAGSGIIFSRSSASSKIMNSRLLRNRQQGIRMSGANGIEAIGNVATDNHEYDISIDKASKSYKLSSNTVSKPGHVTLQRRERIHFGGPAEN